MRSRDSGFVAIVGGQLLTQITAVEVVAVSEHAEGGYEQDGEQVEYADGLEVSGTVDLQPVGEIFEQDRAARVARVVEGAFEVTGTEYLTKIMPNPNATQPT